MSAEDGCRGWLVRDSCLRDGCSGMAVEHGWMGWLDGMAVEGLPVSCFALFSMLLLHMLFKS